MKVLQDELDSTPGASIEPPADTESEQAKSAPTPPSPSLQSRIRLLGEMLRRYMLIVKWMLPEVIWRRRGKVSIVLASDLLSVGAQVGGITIALSYARMLQKGQTIVINSLSLSIEPRESMWLLAVVSVGVLVAWQISSLLRYYSDRVVLWLSIRFEENCFLQILSSLTDRVRFQDELHGTPITIKDMTKFNSTFIRQSGIASRVILETIIPFCVLCISFIALGKISLLLTGMVVGLCVLFMPLLWKVNRQSVAFTKRFFEHQPKATAEKRAILQKLTSTYTPQTRAPEHFEPLITGSIRTANEAFGRRMLVVPRGQMITGCLMGAGVALTIAVFGYQSLMKGRDWGRLAVYIIALRYCMNSLGRVSSAVVNLNRLYPSFGSVYYFLKTHKEHQDVSPVRPEGLTVQSSNCKSLPCEPIPKLVLQPGMRVDVLTSIQLNTIILPHLLQSLFALDLPELRGLQRDTWFTTSNYSLCQMSLREFLQLSPEKTYETLLSEWPEEFVKNQPFAFDSLPVDRHLTEGEWQDIPRSVRAAVALSAARRSEAKLIVLTSKLLSEFTDSVRQAFLEQFSNRMIFVFHEGNVPNYNPDVIRASHVVLLEGVKRLAVLNPPDVKRHADQWDELMRTEAMSDSAEGLDTSAEDDMDMTMES